VLPDQLLALSAPAALLAALLQVSTALLAAALALLLVHERAALDLCSPPVQLHCC
jgi:hypothetical protein